MTAAGPGRQQLINRTVGGKSQIWVLVLATLVAAVRAAAQALRTTAIDDPSSARERMPSFW